MNVNEKNTKRDIDGTSPSQPSPQPSPCRAKMSLKYDLVFGPYYSETYYVPFVCRSSIFKSIPGALNKITVTSKYPLSTYKSQPVARSTDSGRKVFGPNDDEPYHFR